MATPQRPGSVQDNIEAELFARSHDPFRSPKWRWHWATELYENRMVPPPGGDPHVALAAKFLKARVGRRQQPKLAISKRFEAVSTAHHIHGAAETTRGEIEARLLSGEDDGTIARKAGVGEAVVAVYSKVFFDVRDALAKGAGDWLMLQAVGVHAGSGREPSESDVWRYWALGGGTNIVDLLIADHRGRHEPEMPDRALLASRGRFLVRWFTTDWSCRAAGAAILKEGYRLIVKRLKRDATLRAHFQGLRLLYGLRTTKRARATATSASPRQADTMLPQPTSIGTVHAMVTAMSSVISAAK
jgi:hypothetical protein